MNHQHEIKLKTKADDYERLGLTQTFVDELRVSDFSFSYTDDHETVNDFIKKYEWLGKPSLYTTHRFIATCDKVNNEIGCVVTFDMPIAFSKLLGKDTKKLERLLSRGASASWTPKNLASSMIMWCINWMVTNTQYRLFTAYSDPYAEELGTIYQACNFYYLGNNFGSTEMLKTKDGKLKTTRSLRSPSAYRKYAVELGIDWKRGYPITNELREVFNKQARIEQDKYEVVKIKRKHKYAYVLGSDKKETRDLRNRFTQLNKTYSYPKIRGE